MTRAPDLPRRAPRGGRAATALLWAALLAYAAWLVKHAHDELTAELVVQGLERVYRSPREAPDGWVLDPRPGSLAAELRDRYRPGAPVPATDAPRAALAALGLAYREVRGPGDGRFPRVVLAEDGPLLVVGFYGRDPVAFDPDRGVVRLHAGRLPVHVPALELTEAREAPW